MVIEGIISISPQEVELLEEMGGKVIGVNAFDSKKTLWFPEDILIHFQEKQSGGITKSGTKTCLHLRNIRIVVRRVGMIYTIWVGYLKGSECERIEMHQW